MKEQETKRQGGRIIYEKKGKIAYFTIDGLGVPLNPIAPAMYGDLHEGLVDFRDDPNVLVGIIAGKGDHFSVGGDIKANLAQVGVLLGPQSVRGYIKRYWHQKTTPVQPTQFYETVFAFDTNKPIIAAIKGYCLGAALMLLCALTDIRVAADNAKFAFTETKRGGTGGAAVVSRLCRQIPYAIAMEMLMTGDLVDAQEAYRVGLVNKVVSPEEVMPTAEKYASTLLDNPPLSVRAVKEGALRELEMPRAVAVRYAQSLAAMTILTGDTEEGFKAFMEKRKPVFRGE